MLNFGDDYSNNNTFTGGIPSKWGALANLKSLKMAYRGLDAGRPHLLGGWDNRALEAIIDELGLASCAEARWPASSCVFKALVRLLHTGQHAEPTAPQAAHLFHELRRLGYKMAVGWAVRPLAYGDRTIYGAFMREAGTTGRTETEIVALPRWRHEHAVMCGSASCTGRTASRSAAASLRTWQRESGNASQAQSGCATLHSHAAEGPLALLSGHVWGRHSRGVGHHHNHRQLRLAQRRARSSPR